MATWRKRATVEDLKTGPKAPHSTTSTEAEEAAIVAFRRHTLLPLDDCLYALQPSIPHLTRSALHRCLQRHGISRLPDIEGDKPKRQRFKRYPIGFFHIDIAEIQTAEGKLYLFAGIDRTSKFGVTQIVDKADRRTAWEFLEHLLKAVPYRVHIILADNGIQLADQHRASELVIAVPCSGSVRGRGAHVTYLSHVAPFRSGKRITRSSCEIKHLRPGTDRGCCRLTPYSGVDEEVFFMATIAPEARTVAVSPQALTLRQIGREAGRTRVDGFVLGELEVELCAAGDSLWVFIRRPDKGGVAMRAAYLAGEFTAKKMRAGPGELARVTLQSGLGEHLVILRKSGDALEHLRVTVTLTPAVSLLIPFVPRDLYPLDANDDPLGARGTIEATQRRLNTGLVYFRLEKPAFGHVLYVQNLTALNPYFLATGTKPESVVGGEWPELGYLPPPAPSRDQSLRAGEPVTVSDAILVFRHDAPPHERESARQFLQMLGVVYRMLELPHVEYRDWIDRAERTLRDLDEAPEATIRHYGHRYVHPYTAAEYPDIMVQMSIVATIHDWGKWRDEPHPLEAEFKASLEKFYDPKLKSLRRYLPNVGSNKDADAVDSWYLYHPMINLGLLALDGDEEARALLMKSIDFGIAAARHFRYKWPVQYKVTDFSVITDVAEADGRGQTDVGGVYAWSMLQAFELTDDKIYLDEARAAIDAAIGLRFDVNYQANLTAWGAAACMRLWRITNRRVYLEQSYVYLASFFHNCAIWESELGHAAHYSNFLGVTCLQDAPYMAIYECFDSFAAFQCYLDDSGPDLEPAARMLIAEYCRYALHRGWFYYPDSLPKEAVSAEQRESNGHIDRKLSFPVEDLYVDGQQAGQVGQEVYGAGAALVFASRAFHHIDNAPFRLYCDHFVRSMERTGDRALTLTLDGGETCTAGLSVVRLKRRKLTQMRLTTTAGDVLRPRERCDDRIDFNIPANGRIVLTWE